MRLFLVKVQEEVHTASSRISDVRCVSRIPVHCTCCRAPKFASSCRMWRVSKQEIYCHTLMLSTRNSQLAISEYKAPDEFEEGDDSCDISCQRPNWKCIDGQVSDCTVPSGLKLTVCPEARTSSAEGYQFISWSWSWSVIGDTILISNSILNVSEENGINF